MLAAAAQHTKTIDGEPEADSRALSESDAADAGIVSHNSHKPSEPSAAAAAVADKPVEVGGRGGLDPVRYGDWEKNGRCIDF